MTVALARPEATLESRYTASEGWVYMTGTQALVRLPIQQRLRDAAAGLNTGGYISGYRGSPLGRYDIELWRAAAQLKQHNIVFRPGLNEDLAATAIWGAQQLNNFPGATVDGVFGIWYGKGPGVDRSADALRHANFTGASPKGGVLALAGDDHGAKSSTAVNFSDTLFIAVGMPVLYPSNTQELLDFGLHGIAMSRFSGCWVGMKVVTDVAEGGGTVYVGPDLPEIVLPQRSAVPPGGLWARALDAPVAQEERLYQHKLPAALAYARANSLNRIIDDPEGARIGVVAAGKAWQDLLQALGNLGGDDGAALGLRLLKVGMVWPLDPVVVRDFARGLDLIVVIEEKRPLLEDQIRSILYGDPRAPRIVGKYFDGLAFDASPGSPAIPNYGEITPELVAGVLVKAVSEHDPNCGLSAPEAPGAALSNRPAPMRSPGFCAGCPHNRSTPVPEGSRALAGIGCHWMATLVNPQQTATASHMGGEGAMWLGQEPFTNEEHVFANIGDGTYAHSGSLAIRQAIAADVPITYKILFNGFVSMTGGQPIEGGMTPTQILAELVAEGVKKLALVVDDLDRYAGVQLPPNVTLRHRDAMDATQREFREFKGVSVILYDQPCATERRRLRKRGKWADPAIRTFINPAVCEGCGDCGRVSNCMAIEPLETEFGRKRRINQSSCNKDYSCVEGFCPSFVTVHGGRLRKPEATAPLNQYLPPVPEPASAQNRRALQSAGRRHWRLRRRHHQPDGRGRGLSRRTVQLQSRPDGPQPKIWRRDRACAHRARAGRAARDPHRRRRSRRADRLRPHRRRGRRIALQAQARQDERGDFRRPHADRRFRPQSELERGRRLAHRTAEECARGQGAHSRRATPGQRAPGRPDRLQHVHARRRLAKGPGSDPPRGDRSRNRAQRRRRRRQQTGVRMGPTRGA